jgi:hypothetical protein
MTFPRARLVVAACLFVGWLGFLLHLTLESARTVVLSRPQLQVSNLCILAEIKNKNGEPDTTVRITRVVWSAERADGDKLFGTNILIPNLLIVGPPQGYRGAGEYIVPLTKRMIGEAPLYLVTSVPPTPGYVPASFAVELSHLGSNTADVAKLVAELLDISEAEASDQLKRPLPARLAKNIPRARAFAFDAKMNEVGAGVRLQAHDARIYAVSPHTLDQLESLATAKVNAD